MPLLAKTTQQRYDSVIENYLIPAFGKLSLADLQVSRVQAFFTGLVACL
jgi:hypothetical protein